MAQTVKNLPVMGKTQVQSLGWEDPLEKGMATHSSILAWRIPWNTLSVALPAEICRCLEMGLSSFDIYCCTYSLTIELEEEPCRL